MKKTKRIKSQIKNLRISQNAIILAQTNITIQLGKIAAFKYIYLNSLEITNDARALIVDLISINIFLAVLYWYVEDTIQEKRIKLKKLTHLKPISSKEIKAN